MILDETCVDDELANCGIPLSYQGHEYATVRIGNHCWFAENLRSENYSNGDAILANLDNNEWEGTQDGATAISGESPDSECYNSSPDGNACDPSWALNEYGRLYNGYAVADPRNLCPSGWRVSSFNDWNTLTDFVGGQNIAGTKLRATYGWSQWEPSGTDDFGFTALPGGMRTSGGAYWDYPGWYAYFWGQTEEGLSHYSISPWDDAIGISPSSTEFNYGRSVRCIQDTEW